MRKRGFSKAETTKIIETVLAEEGRKPESVFDFVQGITAVARDKSQANVRRIKAGVSIEELAADIARRTLLQSLTVRPILGDKGAETGMFEVPAGGRRFRALELLVKQKRLARTAPIPCVVRTEGLPEEDSLAENIQRAPLHPLDQFRAFLTLARRASPRRRSRRRSSSRSRWCASARGSRRCRPRCSTSMPRTG